MAGRVARIIAKTVPLNVKSIIIEMVDYQSGFSGFSTNDREREIKRI